MTLSVQPGKTKIGWIGTGVMGHAMCGHLMDAGFETTVFSRTKTRAESLLARGATWAESPKTVALQSEVIFCIVGFPGDVKSVMLGDARTEGALSGCQQGNVLVDMTTSRPELAIEIHDTAKTIGVHSVDAPVSGGDVGAKNATLSIMIGGDADVVAALDPCWQAMGNTVVHQGPAGAGRDGRPSRLRRPARLRRRTEHAPADPTAGGRRSTSAGDRGCRPRSPRGRASV